MTANLNLQNYISLLIEMLPVAITNDGEHQKFTTLIANFMRKGEDGLSPEETEILRLLAVLVVDYEKQSVSAEPVRPHIFLRTLLEDNFMKQKDLLPVFKTESAISEIISGRRTISGEKARQLGGVFHVDYKLFL